MKLLFELAGDHPDLPFAELDLVGTVLERGAQVALVECTSPEDVPRLALAHTAMEYLGSCEARLASLKDLLRELRPESPRPFAARARKIFGNTMDATQAEIERTMGLYIRGQVRLHSPEDEFRVLISGDRCHLGRVTWRNDPKEFAHRRPGDRPFFHPGVMMPRMVRALLNLSCARRGERMLDPFCGTGGMVLEAERLGIQGVGSDIDPMMAGGSRLNVPGGDFPLADSRMLPFRDGSFDAVVTDLPYGQSVSIRAESTEILYREAIEEIGRVLCPGRRAVLVTHRDAGLLVGDHLHAEAAYTQRVHKSLTRHILVLRR
ncbi:MAG: methyltransferase domain-containing protein [Methanolinea sp.]|nr:methyltransferase domain-containing protein [Methanolinea sp.]